MLPILLDIAANESRTVKKDDSADLALTLQSILLLLFPIILLIIGVPGNMMTIFVLTKRSLKDNVFSVYLTSMCVFNITTLLCHMPRFITQAVIYRDLYFTNAYFCVLFRIFSVTVGTIANWHLVIITSARMFYVIERTKRLVQIYCYPPYVILALTNFIAIVQVPGVYYWLRFQDDKGETVLCYQSSTSSLVYVQIIFQTVCPALLIISMNLWIVAMHKTKEYGLADNVSSMKMRQQLITLLAVSSVQYLICMLPTCIYFPNQRRFFDVNTKAGRAKAQLVYSLVLLLLYANNATNFITYCFFGRRFRKEFFRLLNNVFFNFCPQLNIVLPISASASAMTDYTDKSAVRERSTATLVDLKLVEGEKIIEITKEGKRLKIQRESIV
ncbi:hypothetical protein Btru_071558 [Bulinus truncatus]|nr:hypothetical protein Btru_071558 [Bulinus truncatus]